MRPKTTPRIHVARSIHGLCGLAIVLLLAWLRPPRRIP